MGNNEKVLPVLAGTVGWRVVGLGLASVVVGTIFVVVGMGKKCNTEVLADFMANN